MEDLLLHGGNPLVLIITEGEVHVLCTSISRSCLFSQDKGGNLRRHCVAAPLFRLSIVAQLYNKISQLPPANHN